MSESVSVLQKIALNVSQRLEERKALRPIEVLIGQSTNARIPHDVLSAFRNSTKTAIIAEVKFTSPALGALAASSIESVEKRVEDYLSHGAAMISVLTEQDHFSGSLEYLIHARKKFSDARLLMKDFVIDEYQLYEARVLGADAVLLIVSLLGEAKTDMFLKKARELKLTALVEVHNEQEMQIAAKIGADFIGVNNRDLKTLKVSLETSKRLAPLAPAHAVLISESGLSTKAQIENLKMAGFKGFLMGTSFMRSENPGRALAELLS